MSKISGIGNSQTRKNEITADDIATLRRYTFGWDYGVINRSGWNFNATTDKKTDTITVDKGIMFAYGYFGILPESIKIPFIKPSATQYRIIYAEIDRSVIPNTFKIKVKNNQGSNKIKPTTFRQDYLTAIKTGVFQLPLWQVELNNEGIEDVVDVRELKDYIKQVHHTNYTTGKVTKSISENAIATTQPITNISKRLATTEFVHKAVRYYIDTDNAPIYTIRITPRDIMETGGISFEPSYVEINKLNPMATFKAVLEDGYDVDDYLYVGGFELNSLGNYEYEVKLVSLPTQNESFYINFYVTEI